MALSKEDKRELSQDTISVPHTEFKTTKKKSKKLLIIGISIFLVIIFFGSFIIVNANKPGPYDEFAKCLSEKGITMYGALNWCKYTQAQKAMFGKSFKHLDYFEFEEFPEDQFGKIKITPSWIINGKVYENVLSIDRLAALSGCKI